jgi:hypothetical protein
MRQDGLERDQVPASWFVASEIHLDGVHEDDLIVQPRDLGQSPSPNHFLFGARIVPFWVLLGAAGKYRLVLGVRADGLDVLDSRTNGYKDIQVRQLTATKVTTVLFKRRGKYEVAETKTEP